MTGNIAIIPARGGSKRIPKKNIKDFGGKPMISYAIGVAQASELFDRVCVSTDDSEIAEIALKYGAEVPFMRPSTLSDDFTPTVPVISDASKTCAKLGWDFINVCCIYPSVPFLTPGDLKGAYELWGFRSHKYCFPVAEFPSPIQRAMKRGDHGELISQYPIYEKTRTQDLESTYFDAGQFYWGNKNDWEMNLGLHSNGLGFIMPSWRAVDIDTPDDWRRAEALLNSICLNR